MSGANNDVPPTCGRCLEPFPTRDDRSFSMGQLTRFRYAPRWMRQSILGQADEPVEWLCGNCYHDLNDDHTSP